MRLHREACDQQAVDQSPQSFDIVSCDAVGSGEPYFDIVLHQRKCRWVERFLADGVGQYPIGACDHFAGQVAVAPRGHSRRRLRNDVEVRDNRDRRCARERAFESTVQHCRAGRRISIH